MKRRYSCPHCKAVLNPGTKIVLRAEHGAQRGLILFSPQPGNYDAVVAEGLRLKRKEQVQFACPVCGHSLTSRRDPQMAQIEFVTSSGEAGSVAFSRTFGEHATYFITAESVRSYGEHADTDGVNFWGVGPDE